MSILEGKKTYIVAAVMLIHAVSGAALGEQVNWNEVFQAVGLATLRQAVAKAS